MEGMRGNRERKSPNVDKSILRMKHLDGGRQGKPAKVFLGGVLFLKEDESIRLEATTLGEGMNNWAALDSPWLLLTRLG